MLGCSEQPEPGPEPVEMEELFNLETRVVEMEEPFNLETRFTEMVAPFNLESRLV